MGEAGIRFVVSSPYLLWGKLQRTVLTDLPDALVPIIMIHLVTIFSRRTTRTSRTRKTYRTLYSITSSWTLGTFFTLVLKKIKQSTLSQESNENSFSTGSHGTNTKLKNPSLSKPPPKNRKHCNRKKTIKGREYIRELHEVIMEADVKYTCTLMQSGWVRSFNERLIYIHSLCDINRFSPS